MVQDIIFSIFFIQKQFMKWNANFSYCTTQLDRKLKIQASWWCYLNRTSPKETFHCYTPSMAPAGRMLWQSWSYCILSSHRKFQRSPTDSKKIHIQDEMMRSTDICTCPKEPQLTMYNTCCLGSSLGSLGWQSYPRAGLSGSNKILSVKKTETYCYLTIQSATILLTPIPALFGSHFHLLPPSVVVCEGRYCKPQTLSKGGGGC